jgi:hypothetical protein
VSSGQGVGAQPAAAGQVRHAESGGTASHLVRQLAAATDLRDIASHSVTFASGRRTRSHPVWQPFGNRASTSRVQVRLPKKVLIVARHCAVSGGDTMPLTNVLANDQPDRLGFDVAALQDNSFGGRMPVGPSLRGVRDVIDPLDQ